MEGCSLPCRSPSRLQPFPSPRSQGPARVPGHKSSQLRQHLMRHLELLRASLKSTSSTLSEPNMLKLGICSQDPKGCCQEGPSQQVSGRQGGSAGMPVLNGTMLGLKLRAAVGAGMPSRLRRAPEIRV